MRRVALALLLAALAAAPARAERAKLFPLTATNLPPALAHVSAALTRALAAAIDADVSSVPIEDAAGLLDCDLETTPCLDAVSKSVNAHRLVFGTITSDGAKLKANLTRFDPGPQRVQRTFVLTSATERALADELVRVSGDMFDRARPEAPITVTDDPVAEPPPGERPVILESHHGHVTATTWALLGSGVAIGGVGAGFLISAYGLRRQVADAPTQTPADFQHLMALEHTGTTRTELGDVLVGAGALVATIAIARAVIQHQTVHQSVALRVQPSAGGRGAVVAWSMDLP